jgi:hypothetical protein
MIAATLERDAVVGEIVRRVIWATAPTASISSSRGCGTKRCLRAFATCRWSCRAVCRQNGDRVISPTELCAETGGRGAVLGRPQSRCARHKRVAASPPAMIPREARRTRREVRRHEHGP